MNVHKKTRIHVYFILVITVSLYCMISKEELYPFAPFTMFSELYSGEVVTYQTIVQLNSSVNDSSSEPKDEIILRFDVLDEARLAILLEPLCSKKILQKNINKNTKMLSRLIKNCMQNKNCSILTNKGLRSISQVRSVRYVKHIFHQLNYQTYLKPDATVTCEKISL